MSTGLDGLQTTIASLEAQYPEAAFETTRTLGVNSMIIVEWKATVDGTVVFPGRTLVMIENGAIDEIRFLNLNSVAPVGGEPYATVTNSRYVMLDATRNAISPERSAFASNDAAS